MIDDFSLLGQWRRHYRDMRIGQGTSVWTAIRWVIYLYRPPHGLPWRHVSRWRK